MRPSPGWADHLRQADHHHPQQAPRPQQELRRHRLLLLRRHRRRTTRSPMTWPLGNPRSLPMTRSKVQWTTRSQTTPTRVPRPAVAELIRSAAAQPVELIPLVAAQPVEPIPLAEAAVLIRSAEVPVAVPIRLVVEPMPVPVPIRLAVEPMLVAELIRLVVEPMLVAVPIPLAVEPMPVPVPTRSVANKYAKQNQRRAIGRSSRSSFFLRGADGLQSFTRMVSLFASLLRLDSAHETSVALLPVSICLGAPSRR